MKFALAQLAHKLLAYGILISTFVTWFCVLIENPFRYQQFLCAHHKSQRVSVHYKSHAARFYVMFIIFFSSPPFLPRLNGKSRANLSAVAEEANSRRTAVLIAVHKFLVHSKCRQYNKIEWLCLEKLSGNAAVLEMIKNDCLLCAFIAVAAQYFYFFAPNILWVSSPREPRGIIYTLIKRMNQVCRLYLFSANTRRKTFLLYVAWQERANVDFGVGVI